MKEPLNQSARKYSPFGVKLMTSTRRAGDYGREKKNTELSHQSQYLGN